MKKMLSLLILLTMVGAVYAQLPEGVIWFEGFEYAPNTDLIEHRQWIDAPPFGSGVGDDNPSPIIKNTEIAPKEGMSAYSGQPTPGGYAFRHHPLEEPVDVTAQTYYLTCLGKDIKGGDNQSSIAMGFANSASPNGQKLEIRFYPNKLDSTGNRQGRPQPQTEIKKDVLYLLVVKTSPIEGSDSSHRVDLAVIDLTNGTMPETEDDIVWDLENDIFVPNGTFGNPYNRVNFGFTSFGMLADNYKLSTSWEGVKATVVPPIAGTPNDATDQLRDQLKLEWTPSRMADNYDVYIGTDEEAVKNATKDDPEFLVTTSELSYELPRREFGTMYYWRVDELGATETRMNLWSFETEPETIPITGVTVTASDLTEDPNVLVDGSGLSMVDGVYVHDNDVATMWKSGLDPQHPIALTFDLGSVETISDMVIWNYNIVGEVAYGLGFGAQDVSIETSLDGENWDLFGDLTLNQGTGEVGYAANNVIDMQTTTTQYVKLTLKTNYSAFQKAIGLSEVQFTSIPTAAREYSPANGETVAPVGLMASWRAGRLAAKHEILLGTSADNMTLIKEMDYTHPRPAVDITEFLALDTMYYWQVNEVNGTNVWEGPVQSFTTESLVEIDRMEDYKDEDGSWTWQTWDDGYNNPDENGSTSGIDGYLPDKVIFRSPKQSLPVGFNNTTAPTSVITRQMNGANLTLAKTLVIHVYGKADNVAGDLFVAMNGKKVSLGSDALTTERWTQLNVDLVEFGSVESVDTLQVGVDGANAKGVFNLDDVLVYGEAPPMRDPLPNLIANGSFEEVDPHTAPITNGAGRRAINANGSFTVPGWTLTRYNSYCGLDVARPVFDGKYYAFVNNNGRMTFKSDSTAHDLKAGQTLRLSFEAASNGQDSKCNYICSIILDEGLDSEKVVDFGTVLVDKLNNHYYIYTELHHTLDADVSTVAVEITMNNPTGSQPRMDDVRLSVVE